MTDFPAPFELRRVLIKFTRTPTGGTQEDLAIVSLHLAKITSGAIDAGWSAADMAAVEARLDTWWTSMKPSYSPWLVQSEYRWYKAGPVFSPADLANGPANPAVRVTARSVAGTSANSQQLPPQVSWTVTMQTSLKKRWGRIYMPAPNLSTAATPEGRIVTAQVTAWLTIFVTLLNGLRADSRLPVVFSRGRSAYVTPRGASIDAHTATAYEITSVQIDNLYDVTRSRRWDAPTLRSVTVLT